MMAEQQSVASIGNISELTGYAKVLRDKEYGAKIKLGINSYDDVRTSAGRLGITFLDDSVVRLTEHSKLVIDEYIYDPDPSKSKMALKFASGTARFITGGLGKINKENIFLSTPTAQISIRGTDFSATVDELGRSLIILLPDKYGLSSGEILVTTAMGSVVLNKPFEATTVSVYESTASKPVILDLTLDIIDNMLIVTPPEKTVEIIEEKQTQQANILDFNDLDIDYLEEDALDNAADLEFTELDINYLDVNFLEDLLDIMEELDIIKQEDALSADATQVAISGTKVGQDLETQITTIIQGQGVKLIRNVGHYAEVNIDGAGEYTVIFIQEGVSKTITINGGGSSVIKITQSS
jgi:hypothetical protein